MNKFFGNIVGMVSLSLFVLIMFTGTAYAQSELLFGQNHFYTVVFRGNGEAITYAKIAVTNPDEKPLTEFSFEVPKVSPTEMVIYQMELPPECQNYNYNDPARPCLQYRDPDYAQPYYNYGYDSRKVEYQKIQYTKSGNLYTLTLPTPVEAYKSTAIIIAYAAKGYVRESLGLYKFNFETLKVPARIQEISVAVDVDSDLLLKGKQSSINYNTLGVQSRELSAPSAVSGANLDTMVEHIGSYGALVKTAKNLSPNESFTVKGEYATSWFILYLGSILLTIFIILAVFIGVYFLTRFLKKPNRQSRQIGITDGQQLASQKSPNVSGILNLTYASISLLSVIFVVGLTYVLRFLTESNLFHSFNPDPIFALIMVITIILMYLLVLTGPAVIIAIKHGWKSLLLILLAEFLWFVLFLVIYFVLFQTGVTPAISPVPPVLY